nr:hypothetical protein [uncultured bacterium]
MSDPSTIRVSRRGIIQSSAAAAALLASVSGKRSYASEAPTLRIDPTPTHELSPFLYMQFMEPLGTNDSSVEASWDHLRDRWRPELIDETRSLAPGMMRWGGLLSAYYKWREGVGPRQSRIPMHNIVWGGIESNQIGTAEFASFSRLVGADALMCVNFESEGRKKFRTAKGSDRVGTAKEAAQWVAYCNQPKHTLRTHHGYAAPHGIRYWQIGNETSYAKDGFDVETAAKKTVEFARDMLAADSEIKLIGWGDSGWAARMSEVAGEHLDYLAFHQMFDPDDAKEPVLRGERYRRDPLATWQVLMNAWEHNDRKIRSIRELSDATKIPLAMTECHFSIPGNNRNDVLRTWTAGVSYARILNNHQRHGDVLKIATAADFCGTRWNVNAIMLGTHPDRVFLMPVARVMRQYRKHLGSHAIRLDGVPTGIDAVASRRGDRVYINLVNTSFDQPQLIDIKIEGAMVVSGRGTVIEESPTTEISSLNCLDVMQPQEIAWSSDERMKLPPASVTSIELEISTDVKK